MPDSVVDASALAAFVFQEARAEEARHALAGQTLHAPHLLAYELTHIAQKKMLANPSGERTIAAMLDRGLSIGARLIEVDHRSTLELALLTGLSSYDAAYVRLARSLGVPLITFDQRMRVVMDRLTQSDSSSC